MKIDWKSKLTSRKFWAAVTAVVTAMLTMFKVNELTIEQVTILIGAFAVLISYIVGEGMVDAAREKENRNGGDVFNTIYPSSFLESTLDSTIENEE